MKRILFLLLVLIPFLLALSLGDPAPDFFGKNQDGKVVRLSDFKGKFVLIYFYPKDDTPGCKKEACNFRDGYSKIKKLNTVILGVSRQDEKSHQEFRAKYNLPFDLLVDSDGSLAKKFDVGTIPLLGFTKRQSILIDPSGKIVRFYRDVDPSKHAQEIIEDITKFGGSLNSKVRTPLKICMRMDLVQRLFFDNAKT